MLFSCPTLDVLMYQVSQVSEQLCQQYVCNVVLYEVSRVGKQVYCYGTTTNAVTKRSVSYIINLCYADSVCLCSTGFVSGSKININIS